jgi:Mg2+ and Co2+ transporter CorA
LIENQKERQISETEDWRNNAAVVFTVVTIVFLPPSFVASVFGMNTVDVRNMNLGQGFYWAASLSVTVAVVGLTLVWVDVPPLRRWWRQHITREDPQ